MDVELGPDHEKLIDELYGLYDRLNLSRDEQLILGLAIQLVEFLDEYRPAISAMDWHEYTPDQQQQNLREVEAARRTTRIHFDCDDYDRLICSGGIELGRDGRFEPRF